MIHFCSISFAECIQKVNNLENCRKDVGTIGVPYMFVTSYYQTIGLFQLRSEFSINLYLVLYEVHTP